MARKQTPKGPEGERRPGGRPPVEIDLRQVEELARIGCTEEDMAAVLGVSVDTLQRRKRTCAEFRRVLEKGQASLRNSLRRLQVKKALEGNPTMLIWLGKQLLGQRDKQDLRHGQDPESGPAQIEYVRTALVLPPPGQPAPERALPAPLTSLPEERTGADTAAVLPISPAPPASPASMHRPRPTSRPPDWEEDDFA